MRRITVLAGVLGLCVSGLLAGSVASAAADPRAGAAAQPMTITSYETGAATTNAVDAQCYTTLDGGGPVGGVICGTISVTMYFDDGTRRKFIIGWDRAVWNIVRYPSGAYSSWRSLGGWAQVGVFAYIYDSRYPNDLTISTVGRDGRDWCRALHGSWWPWGLC